MRDPVSRVIAIDAFRERLTSMYMRVGLVFFMPQTRDRFRDRLYRKWQRLGHERQMVLEIIQRSPALKADYRRRLEQQVMRDVPQPLDEAAVRPWAVTRLAAALLPAPEKAVDPHAAAPGRGHERER